MNEYYLLKSNGKIAYSGIEKDDLLRLIPKEVPDPENISSTLVSVVKEEDRLRIERQDNVFRKGSSIGGINASEVFLPLRGLGVVLSGMRLVVEK